MFEGLEIFYLFTHEKLQHFKATKTTGARLSGLATDTGFGSTLLRRFMIWKWKVRSGGEGRKMEGRNGISLARKMVFWDAIKMQLRACFDGRCLISPFVRRFRMPSCQRALTHIAQKFRNSEENAMDIVRFSTTPSTARTALSQTSSSERLSIRQHLAKYEYTERLGIFLILSRNLQCACLSPSQYTAFFRRSSNISN